MKLQLRFLLGSLQRLNYLFFRPNVKLGKRFRISRGAFFSRSNAITIGDDFFAGKNCHISCPVIIGDDVLLASYVAFVGGDHQFDSKR